MKEFLVSCWPIIALFVYFNIAGLIDGRTTKYTRIAVKGGALHNTTKEKIIRVIVVLFWPVLYWWWLNNIKRRIKRRLWKVQAERREIEAKLAKNIKMLKLIGLLRTPPPGDN